MTPKVTEGYSPDDCASTPDMSTPTTEALPKPPVVDTEGLHDLSNEDYHRDPVPGGSISSSAIKILVKQSPKHAREYQTNGRPPKPHYDLGSAVHTHILGGAEIVYWGEGDGTDHWQTNPAKKFRREAYAAGKIPLLEDWRRHVDGMVDAIRGHDELGDWLTTDGLTTEQSGFWIDQSVDLWCRLRLDAATYTQADEVIVVVDLKTGHDVSPDGIAKAIANNRYDIQKVHYEAGLRRLMDIGVLPAAEIHYILAFVEKTPPYDVVLRRIGPFTTAHAEIHRRYAMDRFAVCRETGIWPGYDPPRADGDDIPETEVPHWQMRVWDYAYDNGDYDTTGDRF